MEFRLNVLHYCIYIVHYKLHLILNKINPVWLLAELPFLKKRYEKLGVNIYKEVNKAFDNRRYGLSMTIAGGLLFGIFFLFIMGLSLLVIRTVNLDIVFTPPYFIIFAFLAFTVCYFYVFKNDKYLKYFKEFDKWPRPQKRKNVYLSLAFIIIVLCVFFGGFML